MVLLTTFYIGLLGLAIGSFINAAAWRLRLDSKESIVHGRSKCPNCNHELSWKDLVPVLSWLYLRGKCRYCSKPISAQYPLVELLTSFLFIASYLLWDTDERLWQWMLGVWLINLTWLLVLAVIDYKTKTLPYKITFPLLAFNACIVIVLWLAGEIPLLDRLLALVLFGGGFWLLWYVSKGKWIGDGDIPLIATLALMLGVFGTVFALFAGSSIGSVIAVGQITLGKRSRDDLLPFGPLLVIGAIISQLYGEKILNLLGIL